MLGWASSQFEKLSQTVAPPPADANGRFVYAVQRGDEDGAMACVHEMDVQRAVLNPTKKSYAIHLACERSMDRLIRMLLTYPGVDLTFIDTHGNTPLHYAAMSTDRNQGLPTVKMLVNEYKASVVTKNSSGQTPYDLATLDMVRQFLLPLQLQEETRQAIDNGGVGLPPGIDMGGLRIANPAAPPPPIMPIAPAPMSSPAPQVYPTPQCDPPKPPSSGGRGVRYARTGGSSAAIYKPDGARYVKADGFHSSSSDVNLQRKYGHVPVNYGNIAPPPSSHNAAGTTCPLPASGGTNPYAGGNNPYYVGRASQRYVAYDAVTGETSSIPRSVPPPYGQTAQNTATPLKYAVFRAGAAPAPAPATNNLIPASGRQTAHSAFSTSHPCKSQGPHQAPASNKQHHSCTHDQRYSQPVQYGHGAFSGTLSPQSYQHPPTAPCASPHAMQGAPEEFLGPALHSGTAGQLHSAPRQVQPPASHSGAVGQFQPAVPSPAAVSSPALTRGTKACFQPPMVAPAATTGGPNAAAKLFSSPVPGDPSQDASAVFSAQQAGIQHDRSDQAPAQVASPLLNARPGCPPNQRLAHPSQENTPTKPRADAFGSFEPQSSILSLASKAPADGRASPPHGTVAAPVEPGAASAGSVFGVAPSVEAFAAFSMAPTAKREVPQSAVTEKASVVGMSPSGVAPFSKAAAGDGVPAKPRDFPFDAAVPESSLGDQGSVLAVAENASASSTPCANSVFDAQPACSNDGSRRSLPGSQGKPTEAPTTPASTSPQPAAGGFSGPLTSSTHPAAVASMQVVGVFTSPPGSKPVTPAVGASLPAAPTSGGFSLVDQAANSSAAADLFALPSSQRVDTNGTQAMPPVNSEVQCFQSSMAAIAPAEALAANEQAPSMPQAERSCSPSGSDEGMDDVPLSPEGHSQASGSIPQDNGQRVDGAAVCPLQVAAEMQAGQRPTGTPAGGESLFAAIGMPPPPFSSKR